MNIAKYIMLMRCTKYPAKRLGVEHGTSGKEIAHRMITTQLPGLPVINNKKDKGVDGIVTEFNVLGALREGMDPDTFTAERIMSLEAITADIDTPAEKLIEIMLENNFTMIPITKNKKLVGIVDRCAIMEFLVTQSLNRYAS